MFEDFLDFIGFGSGNDEGEGTGTDMEGQWADMDGDGVPESFFADLDGDGKNESLLTDWNGDGIFDTMAIDIDLDGVFDGFVDISGVEEDGHAELDVETYAEDTDGDGMEDTFSAQHYVDTDGDGIADTVITETLVDSDNDSHPDYYSVTEETDLDGDGVADVITFSEDTNGDLIFDSVTQWENQGGSWEQVYSEVMEPTGAEAYEAYGHFGPEGSDGDGIIGDPGSAMESWHPQSGNTCAVVSQEFALEGIFGQEFDEDDLREIAEDNGWYDNGTSMEDVGKILEYYGANVAQSTGNSLDDLKDSLADGNQIIVGVDADELWSGQNEEMFGPGMDANHAIQVIGFDESDPANPMVIINDSGVANGQGVMVPAEEFMDAWEDSGCFMVEAC